MIRESEAISLDRVHRSPGYFSLFGKTVNDWRFSLLSSLLSLACTMSGRITRVSLDS